MDRHINIGRDRHTQGYKQIHKYTDRQVNRVGETVRQIHGVRQTDAHTQTDRHTPTKRQTDSVNAADARIHHPSGPVFFAIILSVLDPAQVNSSRVPSRLTTFPPLMSSF